MVTDPQTGTNVHEVADGVYRINTPIVLPGALAFNFNQYLLLDDAPLLFHTGPRQLFAQVRQAIASVMPIERLRYVGFSHVEADECGSLNQLIAVAPEAQPLCSQTAALVSMNDLADRAPHAMADGETLSLGRHEVQWFDAPHVPHGWENGFLMDLRSSTLFCGDLFTQGGEGTAPLIETDILGPSEAFRRPMDYYAHSPHTATTLQKLAEARPRTLACMHGSAWRGDGARLLRQLAEAVGASRPIAHE